MSTATAEQPARPGRVVAWLMPVLVAAVAVIPFLPAAKAGFSDYDDHGFLIEVNGWRGLGPANLEWMFSTPVRGHYQPLTYLSYALNYVTSGLEPAAYHSTNIGLHAAGAVLLYLVALRVLRLQLREQNFLSESSLRIAAALAAVLWAVHPMRVESVAWVTERRDVLSCALLMGATLAYLSHGERGVPFLRSRAWWACLVLLALSLLAKAWGITFVAVAVLLDIRPLRRLTGSPLNWLREPASRAALIEKFPFAALGLGAAALAAWAQSARAARSLSDWGIAERAVQAGYGLWYYVERTVVPRGLSILHEIPPDFRPADPRWLVPAGIAVAAGMAVLLLRRRLPGVAVALACYAVVVSPVLGLFQSGSQLVADRYAHLATIPLFILAACGAVVLTSRKPAVLGRQGPILAAALGCIVIATLGARTWKESSLWRSDAALWQSSIDRGVDGPILRNYFAVHLEGRGRLAEAEAQYRQSVKQNPKFADSWFGLGSVLGKQDRATEAVEAYQQAATCAADPAPALMMMGVQYISKLKKPREALAAFAAAVQITEKLGNPARTGRPYLLLASALGQSGDEKSAVALLQKAREFSDTRTQAEELLREMGPTR